MPLFKKGVETYDYTELQKRGLLKLPPRQEKSVNVTKDGYFDIANSILPPESIQTASSPAQEQLANPFSFLDNPATGSSAASNPAYSTQEATFSPQSLPSSPPDSLEVRGLKNKIEDLEYKLERLLERLLAVESKISSFEGGNGDY